MSAYSHKRTLENSVLHGWLRVRSENETQVATYGYNKGGLVRPDTGRVALQATLLFPVVWAESQQNYNKQGGKLEVAYDANQKVIWYRSDTVGSLEAIDTALCETPFAQAVRLSAEEQFHPERVPALERNRQPRLPPILVVFEEGDISPETAGRGESFARK